MQACIWQNQQQKLTQSVEKYYSEQRQDRAHNIMEFCVQGKRLNTTCSPQLLKDKNPKNFIKYTHLNKPNLNSNPRNKANISVNNSSNAKNQAKQRNLNKRYVIITSLNNSAENRSIHSLRQKYSKSKLSNTYYDQYKRISDEQQANKIPQNRYTGHDYYVQSNRQLQSQAQDLVKDSQYSNNNNEAKRKNLGQEFYDFLMDKKQGYNKRLNDKNQIKRKVKSQLLTYVINENNQKINDDQNSEKQKTEKKKNHKKNNKNNKNNKIKYLNNNENVNNDNYNDNSFIDIDINFDNDNDGDDKNVFQIQGKTLQSFLNDKQPNGFAGKTNDHKIYSQSQRLRKQLQQYNQQGLVLLKNKKRMPLSRIQLFYKFSYSNGHKVLSVTPDHRQNEEYHPNNNVKKLPLSLSSLGFNNQCSYPSLNAQRQRELVSQKVTNKNVDMMDVTNNKSTNNKSTNVTNTTINMNEETELNVSISYPHVHAHARTCTRMTLPTDGLIKIKKKQKSKTEPNQQNSPFEPKITFDKKVRTILKSQHKVPLQNKNKRLVSRSPKTQDNMSCRYRIQPPPYVPLINRNPEKEVSRTIKGFSLNKLFQNLTIQQKVEGIRKADQNMGGTYHPYMSNKMNGILKRSSYRRYIANPKSKASQIRSKQHIITDKQQFIRKVSYQIPSTY